MDQFEPTHIAIRPDRSQRSVLANGLIGRRHRLRRAWAIATISSAATVVVILAFLAAWQIYAAWRLGRVELLIDGPPLIAQVWPDSGDTPLGEPFDIVNRHVLSLPAGDYRLKVDGPGLAGRTYRLAVNEGETDAYKLCLEEGRLLGAEGPAFAPVFPGQNKPKASPVPLATWTVAFELTPGKADLVEWGTTGVIRRDGLKGQPLWHVAIPNSKSDPKRSQSPWMDYLAGGGRPHIVIDPSPDLNGDGIGDVIWGPSLGDFLYAFSGKDGSLLWHFSAHQDSASGLPLPPEERSWRIITAPAVVDCDRDGLLDLIATLSFSETNNEQESRAAAAQALAGGALDTSFLHRRTIMAVSGRTGKPLWSTIVDRAFVLQPREAISRPAVVARARQSVLIAYIEGHRWMGLDPASGRVCAGPIDLGFEPVGPIRHADLDGDGKIDVAAFGPGPTNDQQTLAAFSSATGGPMWAATVHGRYAPGYGNDLPPDWPIVVDLDRDGQFEIVLPDSGQLTPRNGFRGLHVIDGKLGTTRWMRPMHPQTKGAQGLEYVIDVPDIDGDGTRELVAVSRLDGRSALKPGAGAPAEAEPERIYIDAISGKDGHALWWRVFDVPANRFTHVWKPQWWGRGPDGWPLLAIAIGGRLRGSDDVLVPAVQIHSPDLTAMELSTGRDVRRITGLIQPQSADLDGDGLTDLWGEVDGELRAYRGEPHELWRALGPLRGAGDLDQDGVADVVTTTLQTPSSDSPNGLTGSRIALARSGRDGHVLWKARPKSSRFLGEQDRHEWFNLTPIELPDGDGDRDGVLDLLIVRRRATGREAPQGTALPLELISGHTGRSLWIAGPMPSGLVGFGDVRIKQKFLRAIHPGAAPEVVVSYRARLIKPGAKRFPLPGAGEPRLARLSGRDGRVVWDIALPSMMDQDNVAIPDPVFGDLDGDGTLEIVVSLPSRNLPGAAYEVAAFSLGDGKLLWSRQRPITAFHWEGLLLAAGDLDGDGRCEVVTTSLPENALVLEVLDGRDGTTRWTWQHATNRRDPGIYATLRIANLDGDDKRQICVCINGSKSPGRLAILDANGLECAGLEQSQRTTSVLDVADTNGDGRDELLVREGSQLRVMSGELNALWSRQFDSNSGMAGISVLPGRPAVVVVGSAVGIDGASGLARWAGARRNTFWGNEFSPSVLDLGPPKTPPLLITSVGDSTVISEAIATDSTGAYEPPKGHFVQPDPSPEDPRWTRPLPWTTWSEQALGPIGFAGAVALGFVNVILPLAIVGLVARRRTWSIRGLMALPIAIAIPLTAYLAVEPLLPERLGTLISSPSQLFFFGTLAGAPVVAYLALVGWALICRRYKMLAILVGLTIVASIVLAAVSLWADARVMSELDHYSRSGWYLVMVPAAEASGMLVLTAWAIMGVIALVRRPGRQPTADASREAL